MRCIQFRILHYRKATQTELKMINVNFVMPSKLMNTCYMTAKDSKPMDQVPKPDQRNGICQLYINSQNHTTIGGLRNKYTLINITILA